MNESSLSADGKLGLALANAADAVTSDRFRHETLTVTEKPDLSPVTDADRAAEVVIRDLVARERPDDAVVGEEFGETGSGSRRWIVDPIDGTKNYVRGHPVWATLLALEVDGVTTLGVVSAPALGRRWWAERGRGAWTREVTGEVRPCAVSGVTDLSNAFLSYGGLGAWGARETALHTLIETVWRNRGFGDFWSYTMVAEGSVDLCCEPEVSLWDLAAVAVLVEEAGGTFTDLDGRPGPAGGNALATNGLVHDAALRVLSGGAASP